MQLHDTLKVCLLALASRHPENLIKSNRIVLGAQAFCSGCRTALEVIEWLQHTVPALLEENASLVIDAQRCEIYLTDRNEQLPGYSIHYQGKMPLHTEERCPEQA